MTKLLIIAGPEKTGKMPLARHLMEKNPGMALVSRDRLRDALIAPIDEAYMSAAMGSIAATLLLREIDVVVHAWNLEASDRKMWERAAEVSGADLLWLDTREPHVQKMIPPLDDPRRLDWGIEP